MRKEINLDSDNHYMLDIETLDTRPSAHILAIACVRFTPSTGEVHEYREWIVDIEDQQHRTASDSTCVWWNEQCELHGAAAERIYKGNTQERVRLCKALQQLTEFIHSNAYVWSKGIDFDLPILEDAIEEMSKNPECSITHHIPWQYWAKCDVRTLYHVLGKPPENLRKPEHPHNPVSDCLAQIRGVHWCLMQIEALRNSCTNPDA